MSPSIITRGLKTFDGEDGQEEGGLTRSGSVCHCAAH